MPNYTYKCQEKDCKHKFDVFQNISAYTLLTQCPKCNKNTLKRDYREDLPAGNVIKGDSEITLGQLAERNSKRFSDDYKQHLYEKHHSYMWEGGEDSPLEDKRIPFPKERPIKNVRKRAVNKRTRRNKKQS